MKIIKFNDNYEYVIILLHGMYSNHKYFEKLPNILNNKKIKYIFPDAPNMTINWPDKNEYNIQSWYNYYTDYSGLMKYDKINYDDFKYNRNIILDIIYQESKIISFKNIFIGGSSQGGTLAIDIAMNCSNELGGLFCLRTILMNNVTKVNKNYYNMPIFIFSGNKDDVYTIKLQKKSFNKLKINKYKIYWYIQNNLNHNNYSINEFKFIQMSINKLLK